ncbi:MAG TPA: cytochrome c oxidase subunit II [Propioniciclava tarda]|nr:cytochrome c oxidase subunit II [Propioniciclava tarda]HQA29825.1 cytochrome c oxidase subunit II [Propioniciclava tarda]
MGRSLRTPGRIAAASIAASATLLLSGCSKDTADQWARWGMPVAASDRAPHIGNLWNGAWIASMVIGVFVWGLIGWVIFRYRRKHEGETPRQNRYNLPLEILYTIVPVLIISVLFFFTVQAQDAVGKKADGPVHTVNVIGQKWSWTFNYMEDANSSIGATVHEVGTLEKIPDLYLPVGEPVRFNLYSADVDHSFWIPEFYYKLDVLPGHPNSFDVTPTRVGTYLGKCAELCGTYHSAMLFNVHIVSVDEYNAKIKELAGKGQTGEIKPPSFSATGPLYDSKKEG